MRLSPRIRRLNSDFRAIEQLRSESTIIDFDFSGSPPSKYRVTFRGQGFWRGSDESDAVVRHIHEVTIDLNAAYPRMMPELTWQTPIFHPNISASGVVCLGGYGTHWVPSVKLDELCIMLWDMIRYKNYDVESPYNREAAIWAKNATERFPIDSRPLRDRISGDAEPTEHRIPPVLTARSGSSSPGVTFIEPEVVDAEIVDDENKDILFID